MRGWSAILLLGLGLQALGCAGGAENRPGAPSTPALGEADAGLVAKVLCDPLAAKPQPITIDHVVAVGQAADGTLYVVAAESAQARAEQVFVASGSVLQRKRTLGGGSSGGPHGDDDTTVSYEDGATPNRLVFKQRSGIVVGMALVHDQERSFFDALPASAQRLTVVEPSLVAKLAVHNLPGEVVLEHAAHVSDGAQLFVTRPRDDWSYDDFHVFYGRAGSFVERGAVMVSRGSSTWITFELDGAEVTAVFANAVLAPNTTSTLTTPSGELALTLDDVAAGLPSGASFHCFY